MLAPKYNNVYNDIYIYICIHIITYIYTHIYIYYWIFKEKKPVGTGDFLCRGHDVRRIRGLLQVIFGSLRFSPSKVGQGWEYEGITVGWFFLGWDVSIMIYVDLCFYDDFTMVFFDLVQRDVEYTVCGSFETNRIGSLAMTTRRTPILWILTKFTPCWEEE